MDPISMLVAALAAGAVAGLKDTATAAVKDAYSGLKKLVTSHYPGVNASGLEKHPDDKSRRNIAAQDLVDAGADKDEGVLQKAKELLELVRTQDPEALRAIGVNLTDAQVGSLDLSGIFATGEGAIGVQAPGLKSAGPVVIKDVHAGSSPEKKT